MKKIGVTLLLILLSMQIVLAVEVSNLKESYDQHETLIVKFSGNFVTKITRANVLFYREHVRVPMEFGLVEVNEDYYVYAFLPENSGNYSISIEGVEYMKGVEISDENIVGNFSISDSLAVFSVAPGFLLADDDFVLTVQNLQDEKITIEYKVLIEETEEEDTSGGGFWSSLFGGDSYVEEVDGGNSLDLKSGEKKDIEFRLGNISESGLRTVELSSGNFSYEIPVYVYANVGEENKTEEVVVIIEDEEENKTIVEEKNETPVPEDSGGKQLCKDLDGVKCGGDEICDGVTKLSKDEGICCLGECVEDEGSSTLKIIGWIIIIVIVIFFLWFIRARYMRARRIVNVMEAAMKGVNEDKIFRKRR